MIQFQRGFFSLLKEVTLECLPVTGHIPDWLCGTLLRTGPAQFEVGQEKYNHWFDGLAMLHGFSFRNGNVSYRNRFLQSPAYIQAIQHNRIYYPEFATNPQKSFLKRLIAPLRSSSFGANANVNIIRLGNQFVALTETPTPVAFRSDTLDTLGIVKHKDRLTGQHCTPHPHYDSKHCVLINSITHFGPKSSYNLYTIQQGETERRLLSRIPVKEPGYIHSFGITENYIVLVEFPLLASPIELMFSGKPFIKNFHWKPTCGSRFIVIRRNDGMLHRIYEHNAFFAFHHVNAFERSGEICIDICSAADNALLEHFYLNRILQPEAMLPCVNLIRYRLPIQGTVVQQELLSDEILDLPRIHYTACNMKDYKVVYGVGLQKQYAEGFPNQLCKISITEQNTLTWHDEYCYPGEPVFVPSTDSAAEDDGVVLSVVLNAKTGQSFLLILDANSFAELARAELPHHIPFGFHGIYVNEAS